MVDITQSMACIQCGACVSSCLSMEADPLFIGPAALAKAYRFVGDPRDAETNERLTDLAHDPHGIYDCTHCFSCVDACPKGVAPMDQIMRLRRKAGEAGIEDPNSGHSHEMAFVNIIEKKGTLDESLLLQESFAPGVLGKLMPTKRAIKEMIGSLPTAIRGIKTGKMRSLPKLIPGVHHKLPGDAQDHVKAIYKHAEEHNEEFNLYIKGEEGDPEAAVEERPRARQLRLPAHRLREGGLKWLIRSKSPTGPAASRAASPRSCTARWPSSRRSWASSWSNSTAPTAPAPASSPSTTRSSPTR